VRPVGADGDGVEMTAFWQIFVRPERSRRACARRYKKGTPFDKLRTNVKGNG
jgi:hypothetical protein